VERLRVIVGLGNPGPRYARTRHNAGWMVLDRLASESCEGRQEECCGGLLWRAGRVWLFKPLTYMNESGPPVAQLCRRTGLELDSLLVVVDDLNLTLGALRLRPGGSSGGHRGLESVAEALGVDRFPRLRLGIGPLPEGMDAREFVLSEFEAHERETVERMVGTSAQAARCWAREGIQAAMNLYNRKATASP